MQLNVIKCIFVGYTEGIKGYKFFNSEIYQLIYVRSVVFDEDVILNKIFISVYYVSENEFISTGSEAVFSDEGSDDDSGSISDGLFFYSFRERSGGGVFMSVSADYSDSELFGSAV